MFRSMLILFKKATSCIALGVCILAGAFFIRSFTIGDAFVRDKGRWIITLASYRGRVEVEIFDNAHPPAQFAGSTTRIRHTTPLITTRASDCLGLNGLEMHFILLAAISPFGTTCRVHLAIFTRLGGHCFLISSFYF